MRDAFAKALLAANTRYLPAATSLIHFAIEYDYDPNSATSHGWPR